MDVVDVKAKLARIEEIANKNDDEGAHIEQDRLWADVLAAIADGAPNPAELAREALKADDVVFSRWYA